jgi:hypothetical protein
MEETLTMNYRFPHLLILLGLSAWLVGCSGSDSGDTADPAPQLGSGSADPSAMMDDTEESPNGEGAPNGNSQEHSEGVSANKSAPEEKTGQPAETEEQVE